MIARLFSDRSGASATEFTLILPLLLLFLVGIIDAGRFAWALNMNEKATQMGVRYAVATDMVASGLAAYDFVGSGGLQQGAAIPAGAFGKISCTNTSCTCATAPCPSLARNGAAFANILARVRLVSPEVQAANLVVDYENSGLGFAGDPNGPDVAPLVTVRLRDLDFTPMAFSPFGISISMPSARAALTLEDGSGTIAN